MTNPLTFILKGAEFMSTYLLACIDREKFVLTSKGLSHIAFKLSQSDDEFTAKTHSEYKL